MEFSIKNIDFKANEWEVTKAIGTQALHRDPFYVNPKEPPPNFKVTLNMSEARGVRNNGTGTLTVTKPLGWKLKRLTEENQVNVEVRGRRLRFIANPDVKVSRGLELELTQAIFVDPDVAKDRQDRINALRETFLLEKLQIGTFYHPKLHGPTRLETSGRAFSIEWQEDLRRSMGQLFFKYEYKCFRIQIGDPTKENKFRDVIVRFSSIKEIMIGRDIGEPYICFELFTPPVMQEEEISRPAPDDLKRDEKYRRRLRALNDGHAVIAPYAHQLRIVLYDSSPEDVLEKFKICCDKALLRPPNQRVTIQANGAQTFFHTSKLAEIDKWLRSPMLASNWGVAFQIEALLRNGAANTADIKCLRPHVEDLLRRHGDSAGDVMRHFAEVALHRPLGQHLLHCFDAVKKEALHRPRTSPSTGRFFCHHATVTPTRLTLEGPTITQSNRVIREYKGYEDHFLRVSFRDEDRLPYQWDRDVDGESHLQERVGTSLKEGITLAGRHFEFLGYSSSSLREHTVWYVSEFHHPEKGKVTAQSIRDSLGDFWKVIEYPSKYGARMAQAFSGTDPSVSIRRGEWSEIPDIEENNIIFTDGVGTISQSLAEKIWDALCKDNPALRNNPITPSAYQIRFLGCKGVVSVDMRLEGIHMCIRPSMTKFDVPGVEFGTIEIARAIDKPNLPHLNRPLVMVLEDRGAPRDAFVKLQKKAVAAARGAHDSAALFAGLLESHRLCENYRLSSILRRLNALGLELKPNSSQQPLDTPFLARLRTYAINDVLRGVKHSARIPIPKSYSLVGVADEGPAYIKKGLENVYCLPQGQIFACVQLPEDKEPTYLKGMCLISRSPVIHPGDVQRVYAIGRPPANKECLFGHLKNVVVFPTTGTWSLPNGLAGGDLDGDPYEVIQYEEFLVPEHHDPASYPPTDPFKLDRDSKIADVCNFIVEYIYSDVVGLVSDKHIVIAVEIRDVGFRLLEVGEDAQSGRGLSKEWQQAEEDSARPSDYYKSTPALGYIYRAFDLEDIPNPPSHNPGKAEVQPIYKVLWPHVGRHLHGLSSGKTTESIDSLYKEYRQELKYISSTFSLSKVAGSQLREEELVVGTIMAKCTHKRYRSNRIYAMRESMGFLLRDIKEKLIGKLEGLDEKALKEKLAVAWETWVFCLEKAAGLVSGEEFGLGSFGLIGLDLVLRCLEELERLALL